MAPKHPHVALLLGVFVIIASLTLGGTVALGIWNNYAGHRDDVIQDISRITWERTASERFRRVNETLASINTSVCEAAVNRSGIDFSEIFAYIAGNASVVESEVLGRILSVNGVRADNTTGNLDLIAGPGMSIVGNAVENTGVLSLTAQQQQQCGIELDASTGEAIISSNTSLLQLEVAGAFVTGNIVTFEGVDGVEILPGSSDGELFVSGQSLKDKLDNFMIAANANALIIYSLLNRLSAMRSELNVIKLSLNFNYQIIIQLMLDIKKLRVDLDLLRAMRNGTSTTATAVPTGALVPWASPPGTPLPDGYLFCDGALYVIPTDPLVDELYALYQVIGSTYCGSGNECANGTLFALPDLRGRVPVGLNAASPSFGTIGASVGSESITLSEQQIPIHTHAVGPADTYSVKTQTHWATNVGDPTGQQSDMWAPPNSPYPSDNLHFTCPAAWLRTEAPGGGANGSCHCNGIDPFVKNVAIGMSPPSGSYTLGTSTYQLGLFHPEAGTPCSTLRYKSEPFVHSHVNDEAGGGQPMPNVQPSLVVGERGGYLIKT